ncbi:branched-chain amino acid ABC transporter permease [Streptomyces sp. NPDC102360]|uniref:branched-chain amino acid ABC transporter permease n=1 Tax=Streptomyces sp. NPDC102360 TaxID=3366160 RepID=UPI003830692D
MQDTFQTLVSGLSLGAVYALVAMGFSLVYRTMGLVNFAHADIAMIGAYTASTFYLSYRLPFGVAMVVSIVITGAIGLVIERVLRPLENKDFDLMLIGTIGFGIVLQAVAIIIWGTTGRAVPSPLRSAPLDILGIRVRTYDLLVMAVAALAVVALGFFLARTKRGAAMQAAAMDHEAATAVGIDVGRSNALAFSIGAGLAALAGGLVGPMLYVDASLGGALGIKGFAAAMLGGFGSINGAVVGGVAIGVLDSYASGHFQGYSVLVTFLVFTVAIMIRPTGVFGERTVSRA